MALLGHLNDMVQSNSSNSSGFKRFHSFIFFPFISGVASNCGISQIGNANNGQSQSNEFNEPYDNSSLIDVAIGPHFLNGGQERNTYATGYGAWDVENVDLTDDFKKHYEVWLQKEVFSVRIDWDSLKTVYDIEMDDNSLNAKTNGSTAAKDDSIPVIQSTE